MPRVCREPRATVEEYRWNAHEKICEMRDEG